MMIRNESNERKENDNDAKKKRRKKHLRLKKTVLMFVFFVIVSSVLCSPDSIMFTNSGSQARKSRRQRLLASLPAEPEAGTPNTTRIQFRLPDGSRHQRCFNTTDAVKVFLQFLSLSTAILTLTIYNPLSKNVTSSIASLQLHRVLRSFVLRHT